MYSLRGFLFLSTIKFLVHGSERACARSDRRRVRNSTASKSSDSGVEQRRRGDAVAPFPDIAKQEFFKIEKLTERVHCPKAPVALPRHEMCHLPALGGGHRQRRATAPAGASATGCQDSATGRATRLLTTRKKHFSIRPAKGQRDWGDPSDARFVFFCKRL